MKQLIEKTGEVPVASETPESYGDPLGKTKYYKFEKSGIELGFRGGVLSHIHLFVIPHEGYGKYEGEVMGHPASAWNQSFVKKCLGRAAREGQGRQDMLIGYVYPWCRYEFPKHAVRLEFSQDDAVRKVSIVSA